MVACHVNASWAGVGSPWGSWTAKAFPNGRQLGQSASRTRAAKSNSKKRRPKVKREIAQNKDRLQIPSASQGFGSVLACLQSFSSLISAKVYNQNWATNCSLQDAGKARQLRAAGAVAHLRCLAPRLPLHLGLLGPASASAKYL